MATKDATTHYVVYMPDSPNALCNAFYVPAEAKVHDLEAMICDHQTYQRAIKDDNLYLFKCNDLSIEPADTLFDRFKEWLREHPEWAVMRPVHDLQKYFPTGPVPKGDKMIDILLITDSILERFDAEREALKISEERLSRLAEIASTPEAARRGIHSHRPAGNYGPPTALFRHDFARLKHRLEHLDDLEPSSDTLEQCHKLIYRASDFYYNEDSHEEDLKELIESLLGLKEEAIRDGSWDPLILKLKNEDGDGPFQAMIDFAQTMVQYKAYVQRSNCPVILVVLTGPRLEISTAVFTDGIYVDKLLSQDLYLDAWQSETVLRLGRIFNALSLAVAELRVYYDGLNRVDQNSAPTLACMYPDPLPVDKGLSIPELNYRGKLSRVGKLIPIFQQEQSEDDPERPYALYQAKMVCDESRVDVVVKFTAHYHAEAHRILAQKGLAPTLHFCAPLVGGMYMVVMDYVNSLSPLHVLTFMEKRRVYNDVKMAVKLLHEQDLVFGDLRKQNVILRRGWGAMLIDFDWVGKHREDRYPASWNIDENRADVGVERWGLMDKEHDVFMLNVLRECLAV